MSISFEVSQKAIWAELLVCSERFSYWPTFLICWNVTSVHYGYEFFNFWNEIKFLGLQSINFYMLNISTLIFHSETKKSWHT